ELMECGPLRPKGSGAALGAGKQKEKVKDKAQILEQIKSSKKQEKQHGLDKRTPAQVAFERMQEKLQMEQSLKKAWKTHKQRVEDLSRHLDTLTEHSNIPKATWT
ncbi:FA32A protein, partial [Lanius ludovicianus]|nr:FA32A protein [Lanius ludovicianus]